MRFLLVYVILLRGKGQCWVCTTVCWYLSHSGKKGTHTVSVTLWFCFSFTSSHWWSCDHNGYKRVMREMRAIHYDLDLIVLSWFIMTLHVTMTPRDIYYSPWLTTIQSDVGQPQKSQIPHHPHCSLSSFDIYITNVKGCFPQGIVTKYVSPVLGDILSSFDRKPAPYTGVKCSCVCLHTLCGSLCQKNFLSHPRLNNHRCVCNILFAHSMDDDDDIYIGIEYSQQFLLYTHWMKWNLFNWNGHQKKLKNIKF